MATWLFTSESFNSLKYIQERLNKRIVKARTYEGGPWVFAVGTDFVRQDMVGEFDGTVIITMGCYCLHLGDLAQAFIERGASVFTGWDGNVGLSYVDDAAIEFLDYLCLNNMTVEKAIEGTMSAHGPDPDWQAYLRYYPESVGNRYLKQLVR